MTYPILTADDSTEFSRFPDGLMGRTGSFSVAMAVTVRSYMVFRG